MTYKAEEAFIAETIARYQHENGLPPIDYNDPIYNFSFPPAQKSFWSHSHSCFYPVIGFWRQYRHNEYLMENERAKRKKSTDSSSSLASSVPEDYHIQSIDLDAPATQVIKRRATVSDLADRMRSFIAQVEKTHEDLKAALTEVRLMSKLTEETNEKMYHRMTELDNSICTVLKKNEDLDGAISELKREQSLLKKQFEFRQAARVGPPTATPAAAAITSGTAAKAPAKMPSVVVSSKPSGSPSGKKAEEDLLDAWDSDFCPKCNSDFPEGTKHVCKN